MVPNSFARVHVATTPLATRRGDWGSTAELRRADCHIRQVRVLPPGTPARHRRLLAWYDLAAPLGAVAGLVCAVVLNLSWPPALLALLLAGGVLTWAAARRVTAGIRRTVRALSVTTWAGESDPRTLADEALMDRCTALADRIDATPRHHPIARELLWGELYFLLPAQETGIPMRSH